MDLSGGSDVALDRFFEHYYRRRPVNATFTGVHDYDDDLPDWSPDGIEQTVHEMTALRDSLTQPVGDCSDSAETEQGP